MKASVYFLFYFPLAQSPVVRPAAHMQLVGCLFRAARYCPSTCCTNWREWIYVLDAEANACLLTKTKHLTHALHQASANDQPD